MVPEAPLEPTEHGLVPTGDGWFVLNARETRWWDREGRGTACDFEGEPQFPQFGIAVYVLGPGEPMAMYHWEADQEDFLVVSGEALLIVEGEELGLRNVRRHRRREPGPRGRPERRAGGLLAAGISRRPAPQE